jgi:hypothetical protein
MPEHVHLAVHPRAAEYDISAILNRLLKIARFQRRSLDFQFFGGWVHGFYGT